MPPADMIEVYRGYTLVVWRLEASADTEIWHNDEYVSQASDLRVAKETVDEWLNAK